MMKAQELQKKTKLEFTLWSSVVFHAFSNLCM